MWDTIIIIFLLSQVSVEAMTGPGTRETNSVDNIMYECACHISSGYSFAEGVGTLLGRISAHFNPRF